MMSKPSTQANFNTSKVRLEAGNLISLSPSVLNFNTSKVRLEVVLDKDGYTGTA